MYVSMHVTTTTQAAAKYGGATIHSQLMGGYTIPVGTKSHSALTKTFLAALPVEQSAPS